MAEQQLHSCNLLLNNKTVTCGTKTTLYSAAVASSATVRLAFYCGLDIFTQAYDDNESLQVVAGLHADAETLAVLHDRGMEFSDMLLKAVALSGRLNVLQYLINERQCQTPSSISHYAARSGSTSMLNWLRAEASCPFDRHTCSGAAQGGHLAALRYLRNEGCAWIAQYITGDAASSGSIEVVEWLRQQQRIKFGASALKAAAGAGQTAICEYLRSIGCAWDAATCKRAAAGGHLDTLRWLRTNDCPWNVREVCTIAASGGFTSILDYLVQQGEVLDAELLTDALNKAGSNSQLPAAQWLRQRGAEWPAVLGYDASDLPSWSGESLAWARSEGCTAPLPAPASETDSDLGSEFDDLSV
jgi:hypothetical protein